MAKRLFVQLQSPSAEILVTSATNAEGKSSSVVAAYKRYPVSQIQSKLEALQEASKVSEENAVEFLKNEIVYLKNASIDVYDVSEETGEAVFIETIIIDDTRTVQPVEGFWETPAEALAVLLDNYMQSGPWKPSFAESFTVALYNRDFKEAEIKNS